MKHAVSKTQSHNLNMRDYSTAMNNAPLIEKLNEALGWEPSYSQSATYEEFIGTLNSEASDSCRHWILSNSVGLQ